MPANRWFVGATPLTTSPGVSTARLVVPSRLESKSHLRTSSAAPRRYILHDELMGFSTRNRLQSFEGAETLKQAQVELKAANLALARTTPGSQGRQRARARLAKTHRKVVDTRRYLVHQASRALVDQCQVLVIEDLNVAGMVRNGHLARSLSDAAMGEFSRQLLYRARWHGWKCEELIGSSRVPRPVGAVASSETTSTRRHRPTRVGPAAWSSTATSTRPST